MSAVTTIQALHLLAPLVALAVMAAGHALLCRIRPDAPILNLLVVAGFLGLSGLVAMQFSPWWPDRIGETLWLPWCWLTDRFTPVWLTATPISSISGMPRCASAFTASCLTRPKGIQISELRAKYDEAGMLSTRLRRMLDAEDLDFDGAVYRIKKSRLLAISNVIFALKKAVLGRHSEFTS